MRMPSCRVTLTAAVAAALIGGPIGCATATSRGHTATAPVAVHQAEYGTLPATTIAQLTESLDATKGHEHHLWRDTTPLNPDGTLNGHVEIPRGELTKHEFDISKNQLEIDRQLPAELVGYPINYGFVPQTIAYDGDPLDVLVLGPALSGGTFVKGRIVGLMYFDDEKGPDMKVVISPVDENGEPLYELTAADKVRVGGWFDGYKRWEAREGKWSKVSGWGDARDAKWFVDTTHRFFEEGIDKSPEVKRLRDQRNPKRP